MKVEEFIIVKIGHHNRLSAHFAIYLWNKYPYQIKNSNRVKKLIKLDALRNNG